MTSRLKIGFPDMPSRHNLQEDVAAGRLEAVTVWSKP